MTKNNTTKINSNNNIRSIVAASAITIASAAAITSLSYYYYKKKRINLTQVRFDLSVSEIQKQVEIILTEWKKIEDDVASLLLNKNKDKIKITYSNSVEKLAFLEAKLSAPITNVTFLAHVSSDKLIRDACTEAEKKIDEYEVRSMMRQDVYAVIKAFKKDSFQEYNNLPLESKRYVDRLLRDFERNGLHLDIKKRDKISDAKSRLSKLSIDFQKNITEEDTTLIFTENELVGVSQDLLESILMIPEDNKLSNDQTKYYKISLQYPHVFPILKTCKIEATRKKVELAFNRRCITKNITILEEIIWLRHQTATLLGHKNHASYILDVRMAKDTASVDKFLNDLNDKMSPLAKKEIKQLLQLKKDEVGKREFDGKINMWDLRYYMNLYEKIFCNIDHEEIKQYFPLSHVTKELLKMYEELLSLEFRQVCKPHVWHRDVKMFSVYDAKNKSSKNTLVGYFYLDLFPRQGKYSHAACFGLQPSCINENGQKQVPIAAMVANFTPPTKTKPSLLRHDEVVTFFHEFGHVMHQVCSETNLRKFAGTAVERDFVEAPSQMLENWCWEKLPLQRLSSHYITKKPLSDEQIDRLINTRNANTGLLNKRQLLFALFDQKIHTQAKADMGKILSELHKDILLIEMTPDTNLASSFGHIAGGYDAQYYGYLWSEVFSMDMFQSRFKKEGLLNSKVGLEYRNIILARGGTRDSIENLIEFLGREPNEIAFLKSKGL